MVEEFEKQKTPIDDAIYFAKPEITEAEINAVTEVLKSGWITTGPNVAEFEKELAEYLGAEEVVCVNSGTGALHISLADIGIGPDSIVFVPVLSFVATANVVRMLGAKVVFVDVEKDTKNIDTLEFEKVVKAYRKENPDTLMAVIPVHIAGFPADIDIIEEVADDYNVSVVQDAAHAFGTEQFKDKIGSDGNYVCFSFYATKNLSCGEGGAIATDDPKIAERLRLLRLHGLDRNGVLYNMPILGYKYNMTDIHAAIGREQLKRFDATQERRKEICDLYHSLFAEMEMEGLIERPISDSEVHNIKHAWHMYQIRVLTKPRSKVIEILHAAGIMASVHFIPLHRLSYYATVDENRRYVSNAFPIAEEVSGNLISLPLHTQMTDDDVLYITETIQRIMKS